MFDAPNHSLLSAGMLSKNIYLYKKKREKSFKLNATRTEWLPDRPETRETRYHVTSQTFG